MQKLDTILLIDDDNISNYLNQDLISGLRIAYSIPIAYNGKEGLDYLQKIVLKKNLKLRGLILLDIQMPVMDGYEFLVHFDNLILQSNHNINLAILTSDPSRPNKKLKKLGSYEYLQKPLTEEKILYLLNVIEQQEIYSTAVVPELKKNKGYLGSRKVYMPELSYLE